MEELKFIREFDVAEGNQQQLYSNAKGYGNIQIKATGSGLDGTTTQVKIDDGDDVEALTNDAAGTVTVPQNGTANASLTGKDSTYYMPKLEIGNSTIGIVKVEVITTKS